MLTDLGLLVVGGVMLYFGAEWLVRGAAGMARASGLPPIVIGLTVVSYGTSAPELSVSVNAALNGSSVIALGNVVGSNIANIGLILGFTALIAPPRVDPRLITHEVPVMLVATLALPLLLLDGSISIIEGVVFLVGSALFTVATLRWSKGEDRQADDTENGENLGVLPLVGMFLVGLLVLVKGGDVFVEGAIGVAKAMGMSERMVALTIVAFGTSLPELAASLVAAIRGHAEIAIGNVVGSNIFNLLLIIGAAALVRPIEASIDTILLDVTFMIGLAVFAAITMRNDRVISRAEGALMISSYVGFIGALVAQS